MTLNPYLVSRTVPGKEIQDGHTLPRPSGVLVLCQGDGQETWKSWREQGSGRRQVRKAGAAVAQAGKGGGPESRQSVDRSAAVIGSLW